MHGDPGNRIKKCEKSLSVVLQGRTLFTSMAYWLLAFVSNLGKSIATAATAHRVFNSRIAKISAITEITKFREIQLKFRHIFLKTST